MNEKEFIKKWNPSKYGDWSNEEEEFAKEMKADLRQFASEQIQNFINEIKEEFINDNWEYLDYIKDRLLNKTL